MGLGRSIPRRKLVSGRHVSVKPGRLVLFLETEPRLRERHPIGEREMDNTRCDISRPDHLRHRCRIKSIDLPPYKASCRIDAGLNEEPINLVPKARGKSLKEEFPLDRAVGPAEADTERRGLAASTDPLDQNKPLMVLHPRQPQLSPTPSSDRKSRNIP